jgi:hypothetical protein
MSYVPGSRCVTGLPEASRNEMVKESFCPTVATSFGLSARAMADGSESAASRAEHDPQNHARSLRRRAPSGFTPS